MIPLPSLKCSYHYNVAPHNFLFLQHFLKAPFFVMEMALNFFSRVCLQIPDGPSAEVQEILEEFLTKWRYVDGKYYTVASMEEFSNQISLGVDKYLEIIELYVITFLGRILGNFDLAISWVEKSPLPEEKRQVVNNVSCII